MSDDGASIGQRIDRWLWSARFFKSRTLATRICSAGKVRVNRKVIAKASSPIRVDDVLTFPQARTIRVVRVVALAERRGPAPEAQTLYEDLAPPHFEPSSDQTQPRSLGQGRPTKRDRRAIDRFTRDVD